MTGVVRVEVIVDHAGEAVGGVGAIVALILAEKTTAAVPEVGVGTHCQAGSVVKIFWRSAAGAVILSP